MNKLLGGIICIVAILCRIVLDTRLLHLLRIDRGAANGLSDKVRTKRRNV